MKSKAVYTLLFIGLCLSAAVVRSDDDAEEAPAPKPKPKAAKGGAPYSADIPLEALSKLPVEPLSMDAAALRDDDTQFELFNAEAKASDKKNIQQLQKSLHKATTLMEKMHRDLEAEKVWTKNVYDIIQNYQYKYLKTIEDVRMREKKLTKMERLVELLKRSTLHAGVETELSRAAKALNELVTRSGPTGAAYTRISRRMTKLKEALKEVQRPRQLHSETTAHIKKILRNAVPPHSSDALSNLVNGKPKAPAAGGKAQKAKAAKAATAKAKAGKAKAAGKRAKGKGKGKKAGRNGKRK